MDRDPEQVAESLSLVVTDWEGHASRDWARCMRAARADIAPAVLAEVCDQIGADRGSRVRSPGPRSFVALMPGYLM
jgi:hypothetical protein